MVKQHLPNEPLLHYLRQFETQSYSSQDAWLKKIQTDAIAKFQMLGFPSRQNEAWKYTSLTGLAKHAFIKPAKPEHLPALDLLGPHLFETEHRLVFVNGHFISELSFIDYLPEGVSVGHLSQAFTKKSDFLEEQLAQCSRNAEHGFMALNAALMGEGAYIHMPKNTHIMQPIHLLYIAVDDTLPYACHPRNLIFAGEGSQATLVESYIGLTQQTYFTNVVTEFYLQGNAHVAHYKVQAEGAEAFHIGTVRAEQSEHSCFSTYTASLGGRLGRSDTHVLLQADGASCNLNGLYWALGHQHLDHNTRIEHLKPHCTSRELYKGILDDAGHAVFNGQVYVHPNAFQSNAQQTNKNLLLSQTAEIDSKPQLEIYNDDVKCTHGATVGQLDESALFYLRARGLDEQTARRTLLYAFAEEMLECIEPALVRNYIQHYVMDRIPKFELFEVPV